MSNLTELERRFFILKHTKAAIDSLKKAMRHITFDLTREDYNRVISDHLVRLHDLALGMVQDEQEQEREG